MAWMRNRREAGGLFLGAASALLLAARGGSAATVQGAGQRRISIPAHPDPLTIDLASTAVLVIDMENDFGAKGGMFDRAGVDIGPIRAVVPNVQRVLAATRAAKLPVVYVNMAYQPDLSDAGRKDGPNRLKQDPIGIGRPMTAPDGTHGAILVRDSWNTQVIPELSPQPGDLTFYKTRYSGFGGTTLHATLQARGISNLIVTGCTTSICVESAASSVPSRGSAGQLPIQRSISTA